MYLHVITYNEGAIRLDERRGFARVKVIKGEGAFFVRFPPGRTGSRRAFPPGPDGFPRAEERDFDRPPAIMTHFVFTSVSVLVSALVSVSVLISVLISVLVLVFRPRRPALRAALPRRRPGPRDPGPGRPRQEGVG